MPKVTRHLFIIGVALLIGLTIRAGDANAIYSPRISIKVSEIKQHVQSSQSQNGKNTILEEIHQIKAYDRAKREQFRETGIAGEAKIAQNLVFETTFSFLSAFPLDSILMVFNFNAVNGEFISNCLRDDIWHLESLRDLVGAEMIKAYMLRDTYHGALLMEDYKYLNNHINLLRRYGSDPLAKINITLYGTPVGITSNQYFFGEAPKGIPPLNYYSNVGVFSSSEGTGCPEGEFEAAIEEVVNSWKTLNGTIGGHSLFSAEKWGSIMSMAKANARAKAKQWIRANQITLTLGGESGGNVQSLVKGGGWDKFTGSFKTQLKFIDSMVGMVTPFFNAELYRPPPSTSTAKTGVGKDCRFYYQEDGVFRDCSEDQVEQYKKCRKDEKAAIAEGIRCDRFRNAGELLSAFEKLNRQMILQQENAQTKQEVETAFLYSVTLDSVAEQNLYEMDQILWDMNSHIKRGYEGVHKNAGPGIPTLTKEVRGLTDNHCQNK